MEIVSVNNDFEYDQKQRWWVSKLMADVLIDILDKRQHW